MVGGYAPRWGALEIMLKAKEAGRTGQTQQITSSFTPPSFALPDDDLSVSGHKIHDCVNHGKELI
jgi:hypothetical protein